MPVPIHCLSCGAAVGDDHRLDCEWFYGDSQPRTTIERIGYTRRAFRIQHNRSIVQVRTRSPRRYLVVNLRNGDVEKRSDSLATAVRAADKAVNFVVVDTREGAFVINRIFGTTSPTLGS